jgi:glucose-6-phosphate dehydrogenase assembly protein OpcA
VTSTTGALSEAVAKIESELSAFWAATADAEGHMKARAATMNFIAVGNTAEVDALRATVEILAQTRAGRAFLVTQSGRIAPWEVESDVAAVCHKEGDTVVCYDRIELFFGAMAALRAPSVISALSLSEVPTIVELGKGAAGPLGEALAKAADRVIVDTAQVPVTRIAELAEKTSAPIADRAFVRTFSWRELTARFFDEAPGAERAIGRVEIERSPSDRSDPAAIYLGWLASRLHWRFDRASRAIDIMGMPVEVIVRPSTIADAPPGELTAVRIISAIDGRPLFCGIERLDASRCVRWWMSGPRSSRHTLSLGFRDEGWVLRKAIDASEGDAVYREAVAAGAQWAESPPEVVP